MKKSPLYVCPEAVLLSAEDNQALMQSMLAQAEEMQTTFRIFDIIGGDKPDDSFSIDVDLGSTMIPEDILNGLMKVTVKVVIIKAPEFIVVTFQQHMVKSG